MNDLLFFLFFFGPPTFVWMIWRIDYRALEAKYNRLGPLAIEVTEERNSLRDRVRELEQDLETITRHRDSLKSELVYLGWDLETAQQLHKIAEHKLEQAGIE
jgi:chromosome segregation ATPase